MLVTRTIGAHQSSVESPTMMPYRKSLLASFAVMAFPLLLAACGGANTSSPDTHSERLLASSTAVVAADYQQSVQQLYIAYFGRPADSGGLASFEAQLAAAGAPVDVQRLTGSYDGNPAIRSLVDSFAVSDESKALYSGDTRTFVTAIYANLLNRAPDAPGLAFWVDAVDNKGLNRANASLAILAGAMLNTTAQGQIDARVINNKVTIATNFTAAVPKATYRGNTAAAIARAMLAKIDQNTTLASFQPTITSTIKAIADAVPSIYAGNYSGSYDGSDTGTFTFTIDTNGAINGNGKSSVYGTVLVITGTLGSGSTSPLPLGGYIGPYAFSGTIDAATGRLVGNYSGSRVAGNIVAQRAP